MNERNIFRMNIRAFAEYLFLEGSLGLPMPMGSSAELGKLVHQRLQDRGLKGYRKEVGVRGYFPGELVDLELSGRMDGIYEENGSVHIEEIKSTLQDADDLKPLPAHIAQLELYAWLYCRQECLESVLMDLVYVHRTKGKETSFSTRKRVESLEKAYEKHVEDFVAWLDKGALHREGLSKKAEELHFPYSSFRQGQKEAAAEVFRVLRDGGLLFLQAPTGIGKTMAVLFPAIKALGRGYGSKIFYLTAKNAGGTAAESALGILSTKLPQLRWISLTAKSKICFRTDESGEAKPPCLGCPYGESYFPRIKEALEEFYDHQQYDRALVESLAQRHTLCPFELSLDLSVYCDVVIGDYNYAFDYGAKLQRFFSQGKTDFILLGDEAHNLVDRARAMFSGSLEKKRILAIRRNALATEKRILSQLNSFLLRLSKGFPPGYEAAQEKPPEGFQAEILKVLEKLENLIDKGVSLSAEALDCYWELHRLRMVLEHYDGTYRTIVHNSSRDINVDFLCIDPSPQLSSVLCDQRGAIFFSATLTPPSYYTKLICGELPTRRLELASPFPPENFSLTLIPISTRWKDREANSDRYVDLLDKIFRHHRGNLIVFSPSFAFQKLLLIKLLDRLEEETEMPEGWIIQSPGMSAREKEAFTAAFDGSDIRGFAVAGGSFGESIDLLGERLEGAVIFGLGLSQINVTNDTIRAYFEAKYGGGYAWAYIYPGINRVLQAAGRVIRCETDRGFVYLVDDRYLNDGYQSLLPEWWEPRILRP